MQKAEKEEKLQEIRRFVDYFESLTPGISLDRTLLYFVMEASGMVTGSQTIFINHIGGLVLSWSVGENAGWFGCNPLPGKGSGLVTVSVNPTDLSSNPYTGTIMVSDTAAGNLPQTETVTLGVKC